MSNAEFPIPDGYYAVRFTLGEIPAVAGPYQNKRDAEQAKAELAAAPHGQPRNLEVVNG